MTIMKLDCLNFDKNIITKDHEFFISIVPTKKKRKNRYVLPPGKLQVRSKDTVEQCVRINCTMFTTFSNNNRIRLLE